MRVLPPRGFVMIGAGTVRGSGGASSIVRRVRSSICAFVYRGGRI
jgi:hypothetical protein